MHITKHCRNAQNYQNERHLLRLSDPPARRRCAFLLPLPLPFACDLFWWPKLFLVASSFCNECVNLLIDLTRPSKHLTAGGVSNMSVSNTIYAHIPCPSRKFFRNEKLEAGIEGSWPSGAVGSRDKKGRRLTPAFDMQPPVMQGIHRVKEGGGGCTC